MTTTRFAIIVWPEDHDEDIADHTTNLQDALDLAQVGGARIFCDLPVQLDYELLDFAREKGL